MPCNLIYWVNYIVTQQTKLKDQTAPTKFQYIHYKLLSQTVELRRWILTSPAHHNQLHRRWYLTAASKFQPLIFILPHRPICPTTTHFGLLIFTLRSFFLLKHCESKWVLQQSLFLSFLFFWDKGVIYSGKTRKVVRLKTWLILGRTIFHPNNKIMF